MPIAMVINKVTTPVMNTALAALGLAGNAPLPPLNGVLLVCKSRLLVKSWYSLSIFTLMWAHSAPSIISHTVISLTCHASAHKLSPNNTQTGVKIKKLGRVVCIKVLRCFTARFSLLLSFKAHHCMLTQIATQGLTLYQTVLIMDLAHTLWLNHGTISTVLNTSVPCKNFPWKSLSRCLLVVLH